MRRTKFFFLAFLVVVNSSLTDSKQCSLPEALKNEISSYQGIVENIIQTATKGAYAGKFFTDLALFVDTFGNRLAGTENLENSIRYLHSRISYAGVKVHKEPVQVPYWIRGNESARLLSPREKDLSILGLGFSAGTKPEGIIADVVVVSSFDDLKKKEREIPGKIVLFNPPYIRYAVAAKYRKDGPAAASKLGAVAALVRSATPFSIYSPHTGWTRNGAEKPIPAAAVTLEDADMMARMYNGGQIVRVHLKMGARSGGNRTTHNLIFDLQGASLPEEYVTMSGHIDSWDVGEGALDDGGGAFLGFHSILLLKTLQLPPTKRTIRGIMWSAEEQGLIGAYAYLERHKQELKNWTAALESDGGIYNPLGFNFNGSSKARCIMKEILSLFTKLNATNVTESDSVGSDISVFQPYGVPLLEPLNPPNNYMWFHHTNGDTLRTLNSSDLDKNLALFAATAYILANLSVPLPRDVKKVSEPYIQPNLQPPIEFDLQPPREFNLQPPREFKLQPPRESDLQPLREFNLQPLREFNLQPLREFNLQPPIESDLQPPREFDLQPLREFNLQPPIESDLQPPREFKLKPPRESDLQPPREFKLQPPVESDLQPPVESDLQPPTVTVKRPRRPKVKLQKYNLYRLPTRKVYSTDHNNVLDLFDYRNKTQS